MNLEEKLFSYKEMQEIIPTIPRLRTRAMVACQYGLAARAGELVRYTHVDRRTDKEIMESKCIPWEPFETSGLLQSNIEQREGKLVFSIPNFKNKRMGFKKPYIIEEEVFLFEPIVKWLGYTNEQVFPIRISRFRQLVDAALPNGFSSHALRHSRATHLAEVFGFNAYEIKAFLGHARLDTSAIYVSKDLSRSAGKIKEKLEWVE